MYLLYMGIVAMMMGLLVFALPVSMISSARSHDEACQEIGFKEATRKDSFQYCRDNIGNLYYAHFECDGFVWIKDCRANLISGGDVRTIVV